MWISEGIVRARALHRQWTGCELKRGAQIGTIAGKLRAGSQNFSDDNRGSVK